jgi:hypothetical protein
MGKAVYALTLLALTLALDLTRWYATAQAFGWWNTGYLFIGGLILSVVTKRFVASVTS